MSRRPRPTRRRIWFVLLLALAGLASIVWTSRGHGTALVVCAPETYDHCRVQTRSMRAGTFGKVVVPIDTAGCVSQEPELCDELQSHPAVEFFRRTSLDPITATVTFVVRFAKEGTTTVTAELPSGSYAMYLFVPPNHAIGDVDREGVRVTVLRGTTTRTGPLTPGESSTFVAFGGE